MSKARSITLPFVVWWTPQILAGRRKRTRPLGTTSTGCYKLHVRMGSLLFERCSFFYGTWSRREVLPAIWQHISCRLKIAWTGMLESFLSEQRGWYTLFPWEPHLMGKSRHKYYLSMFINEFLADLRSLS